VRMQDALLAMIRAKDGDDLLVTRLCNCAIVCLTVWAMANSVVLSARYSYGAWMLFGHTGWSSVFTCAV